MTLANTPKLSIDGYPLPARYGVNVFPVAPGHHIVRAHAQWLRTFGRAELPVSVAPGQTVEVYYAAPLSQFRDAGNIGFTKQQHAGSIALIVVPIVFLLFLLFLIFLLLIIALAL